MTEQSKYLEDVLRDMYRAEHERKDKITGHLFLPTSIVVVLAGVLGYYARILPVPGSEIMILIVWGCSVALFISVAVAVYFLVRVLYHHQYGYIPSPAEISEYASRLAAYYGSMQCPDTEKELEKDLRVLLISEYSSQGEISTRSNDRRSGYLHKAMTWIVISLIVLLLSLFPLLVVERSTPKIQKVEVINLSKGVDKHVVATVQPITTPEAAETGTDQTSAAETDTTQGKGAVRR